MAPTPPEYPDILPVRTGWVTFHVLRTEATGALYLIDTGMAGGLPALQTALRSRGWANLPIRGIILTHGHYDHIRNVAQLVKMTGAWVAAPRQDSLHLQGKHPYQGPSRVCGWLEALGRSTFGFEPFAVDHWLEGDMPVPECEG